TDALTERKNTPLIKVRYLPRCNYCYILLLYTYTNLLNITYSLPVANNVKIWFNPLSLATESIFYSLYFNFIFFVVSIPSRYLIIKRTGSSLAVMLPTTYSEPLSVLISAYGRAITSLPLIPGYGPALTSLYISILLLK